MPTARHRRTIACIVTLCSALFGLFPVAPNANAAPGDEPSVRDALDAALTAYNDAKGRLDASTQRQASLTEQIKANEARMPQLQAEASTIAVAAYRGRRTSTATTLLTTSSTQDFLRGTTTLQYLTRRDDRELRQLIEAKTALADEQHKVDDEVKLQQEQVATMEKKKSEAEAALKKAGGGQAGAATVPAKATAKPSPRNSDGSWPAEKCTEDDPTTSGCLTPRTLHAYQEAQLAGYTRYTACFRQESSGEHPKGRACDYSAAAAGFANARASGGDKTYGDKVAGWFIANASALGVLYIIWYNQIWFPSSGWRGYNSGDGTPAGDHYNHVHVSMQ